MEPADEGEGITLNEIFKACVDAPGYVIFTATLDPNNGNPQLNFKYRRYHLNIEDVSIAVKNFENRMIEDLNSSE